MSKKFTVILSVLMILFSVLLVCAGCADNSAEDCDEVTFIDLNRESASSRGIESWNEDLYPPESLYWTYTAKKIRGNYTTGQALTEQAVVKNGPAQGLGTVGPFSVGVWEFNLYGYLSCAENPSTGELEFSDLVYTGKTGTETNNYITIDKRPDGVTEVQKIIFELSATSFWDSLEGQLAIENLKLTVPEGQRISGTKPAAGKSGAEIIIKIWEGTPSDTNLPIAKSITVISEDKESGSVLNSLNTPAFIDYSGVIKNKFNAAVTHNFYIAAEYLDVFTKEQEAGAYKWSEKTDGTQHIYDNGYAPIGAIVSYPLAFKGGVKTTLSGDINDIRVTTDTYGHEDVFTGASVKILKTGKTGTEDDAWDYYASLAQAQPYYNDANHKTGSDANPIILMRNIENEGSLSLSSNIVVKTDGHTVRNLTIGGTMGMYFLLADSGRSYCYGGGVLENLSYSSDTVFLKTLGGNLRVDAPADTVYHTGTANSVEVLSVSKTAGKGYFLGTTMEGTNPITSVSAFTLTVGNVSLGAYTGINTLTISATTSADATIQGRTTTTVGNLASLTSDYGGILKKVVLKANGGTGNDVTKYGISGMYLTLSNTFSAPSGQAFNCWNTAANRSGSDVPENYVVGSSDVTLYAIWDIPVAKVSVGDGKFAYYGSLAAAVAASGNSTTAPVILLSDIKDETVAPETGHDCYVNLNGHKITNLAITTSVGLRFNADSNTGNQIIFREGVISLEFGGVTEINTSGSSAYVNMRGWTSSDYIHHTGSVMGAVAEGSFKGNYLLDAPVSNFLDVHSGTVEINADVNQLKVWGTELTVYGRTGTDAVVSDVRYAAAATGTPARINTWVESNASYAPFVRVELTPYGGQFKLNGTTYTAGANVYYNYVYGLKMNLPDMSQSGVPSCARSDIKFMGWDDTNDRTGKYFGTTEELTLYGNVFLYARWGETKLKMLKTDGKTYGEFGFLDAARVNYDTDGFKPGGVASVPVLVSDIDGDKVNGNIEISCNGYSVRNVRSYSAHYFSVTLHPGVGAASGTHTTLVSPNDCLVSFRSEGDKVYINEGSDARRPCLTVNDSLHDVWVSGYVNVLTCVNAPNSPESNVGLHVCASVLSNVVCIGSGFVDLTGATGAFALKFNDAASGGPLEDAVKNTTVRACSDTNITNLESEVIPQVSAISGQTVLKKITLDSGNLGGGGIVNTDIPVNYYGISGMYVTLPLNIKSDRAHGSGEVTRWSIYWVERNGWALKNWKCGDGRIIRDGGKLLVKDNDVFYPEWTWYLTFTAETPNATVIANRIARNPENNTGDHYGESDIFKDDKFPQGSWLYSVDLGKTWNEWRFGRFDAANVSKVVLAEPGDKVMIRAADNIASPQVMANSIYNTESSTYASTARANSFKFVGKVSGGGSIESLLWSDLDSFNRSYVVGSCFKAVFMNCTGLTTAPDVFMFWDDSDVNPSSAYLGLFMGCTDLRVGRVGKLVGPWALLCMFYNCNKLCYIYAGFDRWGNDSYKKDATKLWVYGCAAVGDFVCPTALPEESGTSRIPANWRIQRM